MSEDKSGFGSQLAMIVVAMLLILTAWGNAWAMFIVALAALVGLVLFNRLSRHTNTNWLAALAGLVIAAAVVIVSEFF